MKSIWQDQHSLPKDLYDLAIVGSGIAGLSVAYWATRLGMRCLIIERGELAQGASGRNAGFLTGGSLSYFTSLLKKYGEDRALELWKLTTENVELMKSELKMHKSKDKIDYKEEGTICLYQDDEHKKQIYKAYELLKKNNFNISKVTPQLGFDYAFHLHSDASYDPYKTAVHIAQNLFRTTICTQTTVLKQFQSQDNIFELETNKGIVKANKVVVATNAHLPKLVGDLDQKVWPVRAQIAYFKANTEKLMPANYSIPQERIYFRKFNEGLIIGGLRYVDEQNEYTDNIELNDKIQQKLIERSQNYFGEIELIQKWSGIMGFTEDEYPIYGESKISKDFYYIGGFSGHGNGYAFKMAKALVDEYLSSGK